MPHIVRPFLRYKKDLREALQSDKPLIFADPSLFNPQSYTTKSMPIGTSIIVTNHPKRSWFARVERTEKGWKVD